MFCGKCGAQIPDGAVFCSKCGNKTGNSPVKKPQISENVQKVFSEEKKEQFKAAAGKISLSDKRVRIGIAAAAGIVILFFIVKMAGSVFTGGDFQSGSAVAESVTGQENGKNVKVKNVKNINSSGDVSLAGELPKLESIILSDGGCLTIEQGAVYPNVTSIQCKSIVTEGYQNDIFSFEPEAFPALQSVTISAQNSQVDKDTLKTMEACILMKDGGGLQELKIDITHTIEDLYGTWTEEQGRLAFTLAQDGSVRVSEGSGLIGADLLNFTEVDNDTLRLKAEGSGILQLISPEMDYMLFGDMLTITLAGNEFKLYKSV